jgi:hypothetical protein
MRNDAAELSLKASFTLPDIAIGMEKQKPFLPAAITT